MSTTARSSESMESTATLIPFPFMDLPLDVRKEVYDCYAGIVSIGEGDEDERKSVTKTRTSLLSVCRQVKAEWSPTFIRTSSIIVHGPRSAYIAHTDCGILTGRSLAFDKNFLQSASIGLINNIRRLCYDASIHGPSGTVNHRIATTVNFQNLRRLAHMLSRSSPELVLLQDVELYARWQPWVGQNRVMAWRPSSRQPSEEDIWALARDRGQWEEIEELLVRRSRRAALKGWEICRNVKVSSRWDEHGSYSWGWIFSVHVHFSKKGTDADGGKPTDPKITVDFLRHTELAKVFIEEYKH